MAFDDIQLPADQADLPADLGETTPPPADPATPPTQPVAADPSVITGEPNTPLVTPATPTDPQTPPTNPLTGEPAATTTPPAGQDPTAAATTTNDPTAGQGFHTHPDWIKREQEMATLREENARLSGMAAGRAAATVDPDQDPRFAILKQDAAAIAQERLEAAIAAGKVTGNEQVEYTKLYTQARDEQASVQQSYIQAKSSHAANQVEAILVEHKVITPEDRQIVGNMLNNIADEAKRTGQALSLAMVAPAIAALRGAGMIGGATPPVPGATPIVPAEAPGVPVQGTVVQPATPTVPASPATAAPSANPVAPTPTQAQADAQDQTNAMLARPNSQGGAADTKKPLLTPEQQRKLPLEEQIRRLGAELD